ncbi:MAG: hypothetical protein CVT94_05260 [Bacteroidetes bacterium HGW-Bacteroidetes-11]|nr:MAG: hypothetical protein CVT94_05260 [Bacteroidetes bacterium HGW-Bacteroidetes-11]
MRLNKIEHNSEMTADQTFKHFDSSQCDIRVRGALLYLINSYSTLYDVLLSPARAGKDKTNNLSLVAVPIAYRNEGQNDKYSISKKDAILD